MGAFCVCRRGQQRLFCTTHHHRLASSSFLATAVGPSIDLMRLSATDGRVVRCGDARGRCSRSSFLNVFEHNVVICFRLEYRSGWCVSENTHTHTHNSVHLARPTRSYPTVYFRPPTASTPFVSILKTQCSKVAKERSFSISGATSTLSIRLQQQFTETSVVERQLKSHF